ncbi:MAG: DUF488 family protein [Dehalococcoidia bacterium]
MIRTGRIYDAPTPDDGYRLLTMRLWPRGVRKDAVDAWEKELGPSRELLRAFQSGDVDWREYTRRYRAEISEKPDLLDAVARRAKRGTVTLICWCKDASRCHRTLLSEIVGQRMANG